MAVYASPLLTMKSSGHWDFLFIWDDRVNFVENELLKSLSVGTLYEMFTMVKLNVYEPLGWLLKYLVVKAVGLDADSVTCRMVALAKVSALVLDIECMLTEIKLAAGAHRGLETRNERYRLHYHACCMSAALWLAHPMHVNDRVAISAAFHTGSTFQHFDAALFAHFSNIHQNLNVLVKDDTKRDAKDTKRFIPRILDPSQTVAICSTPHKEATHDAESELHPPTLCMNDIGSADWSTAFHFDEYASDLAKQKLSVQIFSKVRNCGSPSYTVELLLTFTICGNPEQNQQIGES
ncbi:unnamed protein product [Phytophthora lilii]|uniref:Unnamed protein product n=1 Tax=Phytophthora lilii TaxID=2077276 RepID=A0A9W6X0A4_9STRA|nr:unnamed protein product [Phytophthora lilii]